ncbi:MAG: hypothetical protein WC879_03750 [Melioribacteraceae bacterium]
MKNLITLLISTLIIILFFSCNSKTKLTQENAESAIQKYFTEHHPPDYTDYWTKARVPAKLTKIEPVAQYSETEASSIIYIEYTGTNECKASFKKNIDGDWILISIKGIKRHYELNEWLGRAENLNIQVQ